ncbi:MAG: ion transporter [Planctomycetota bacterium]|jgi:voltage-gated potassium channel
MKFADLKKLVELPDTRAGRTFELTIQTLIVTSLIAFAVETLPQTPVDPLPGFVRTGLTVFEILTVCVFTFEYVLRLYVVDRKLKFVFSFFGIIDFLAILPFYVTLIAGMWVGADLRALRGLRLFRLFRVFKLARYSRALSRIRRAFVAAKEELVLYCILTLLMLYFAAAGIYFFEKDAQPEAFSSMFSSLWWAVATLTTVGYGDVYPVTTGGRLFTFFVLMIGLGVVSVPAGLVAAALEQARSLEEEAPEDEAPPADSDASDITGPSAQ